MSMSRGKTLPQNAAQTLMQDALLEAIRKFGRASHYTLIARGNVVEVLCDLQLHVSCLAAACTSACPALMLQHANAVQ